LDGGSTPIFPYNELEDEMENDMDEDVMKELLSNTYILGETPVPLFYGVGSEDINTIGGFASWVQDWQYIACPDCSKPMKYVAQIQWDTVMDYIVERESEIEEYNHANKIDRSNVVNGRALTNIGVFRAYISQYIQRHPGIHQEMTLMVRQLAPDEHGLPLEIYAFANSIQWAVYEAIQADIFDHLFAVAGEFELRIFQNPAGSDFKLDRQVDFTD